MTQAKFHNISFLASHPWPKHCCLKVTNTFCFKVNIQMQTLNDNGPNNSFIHLTLKLTYILKSVSTDIWILTWALFLLPLFSTVIKLCFKSKIETQALKNNDLSKVLQYFLSLISSMTQTLLLKGLKFFLLQGQNSNANAWR